MDGFVDTLMKAPGVLGFLVLDPSDEALAHQLPSPYEPILLIQAMSEIRSTFDFFSSMGESGSFSSMVAFCEGGRLIVRQINQHTLIILCKATINPVMLGVALNVAGLKLERALSNQPSAPSANLQASWGQHGGPGGLMNSSLQLSASRSTAENMPTPPDAISRTILTQLLKLYATFLGPAAKTILKRELARLGVTSRTLREGQFPDLVGLLAERLPPQRRAEFIAQANGLSAR